MKCPFELPVEKEISRQDREGRNFYRIIDALRRPIAKDLTEKDAKYIVQALNESEKQ